MVHCFGDRLLLFTDTHSKRLLTFQEKKVKKTHEREERIKEQDTLNEHGSRSIEAEKLNAILRSRGLVLSEVT